MPVAGEMMMIDGERFVRAWKRFRERFPEEQLNEEHRNMLQQYVQTADLYSAKARQSQEAAFAETMNGISAEAQALIAKKCNTTSADRCRIPRPIEIAQVRKASHINAVALSVAPTAEPSPATNEPEQPTDSNTRMMELSYEDLKSMMEPKKVVKENLSTNDMRRRFGLVDRDSGRNVTVSETIAREEQESIQSSMVHLVKTLKDRTLGINATLVDDVKMLDAVEASVERNTQLLDRENANLKQQLASSIGFWTSLWLIMGAVMVFMAMYIFMKLFSRRHW